MHQVFDQSRENMVERQIRPNKVTDTALLSALRLVPREKFAPKHLQSIAYTDEDIAVGNGWYLPEPMVLARLIQAACIHKDDVVLDIGCGAGYSAAILGHLAGTVVGIESDTNMARYADRILHDLGIVNTVIVQQGDLREGYPKQAPYNVIFINGSVPVVPEKIKNQLAEGGRLVTVLSGAGIMGVAVLMTRRGEDMETRVLFDAAAPPLVGFELPKAFVF